MPRILLWLCKEYESIILVQNVSKHLWQRFEWTSSWTANTAISGIQVMIGLITINWASVSCINFLLISKPQSLNPIFLIKSKNLVEFWHSIQISAFAIYRVMWMTNINTTTKYLCCLPLSILHEVWLLCDITFGALSWGLDVKISPNLSGHWKREWWICELDKCHDNICNRLDDMSNPGSVVHIYPFCLCLGGHVTVSCVMLDEICMLSIIGFAFFWFFHFLLKYGHFDSIGIFVKFCVW